MADISATLVKELREKTGVGMMECKKALQETAGDLEKAIVWLRERGMSRAAKKADRVAAEGVVCVQVSPDSTSGVVLEVNSETDFSAKNADFRNFVNAAALVALKNNAPSIEALAEMKMPSGDTVGATLTALIARVGENMRLRRVKVVRAQKGTVAGYTHMDGKIGTLVCLEGGQGESVQAMAKDLAMHVAAAFPKYLTSKEVDTSELEQEREIARKKLLEQGKPADLIEKIMVGQIAKFYKEVCLVEQAYVKDPNVSVTQLLKSSDQPLQLTAFARFQLGEGLEKKQDNFADEVAAAVKGS